MDVATGRVIILCVVGACIIIGWLSCYAYSRCQYTFKKLVSPHTLQTSETPTDSEQTGNVRWQNGNPRISNDAEIFHLQHIGPMLDINQYKLVLPPSYEEVIHDTSSPPPSYECVIGDRL